MCRCLRIQPSGFYAWLQVPLSQRAQEDKRQTKVLLDAWTDSGKVYGYRKLHDDLLEQGESICPNRVSRLAQLADIKAQIGYKRRPGSCGGKPSVVVDNTLDRQFDVETPDRVWVTDITYIRTQEQFTSMDWAAFLRAHNLEHSMSRRGNCRDNAVAASFFNLLQREKIRRRTYRTREEARRDVFDCIEMFYNPKRKHARNGMLSPVEFERRQKLRYEGV